MVITTSSAFPNFTTSFFPTETPTSFASYYLHPYHTLLFSPYALSSSQLGCCRFTPTPIDSSLKENLGRVTKTWSDFTSLNYWVVSEYYRLVNSVNVLEPRIHGLSDEQLTAKTIEFRHQLTQGETLADIQAEAFAVVREDVRRKLGMRHFDIQIIGGAVLHGGSIAEMMTGEGKTLVSTQAVYLNAANQYTIMDHDGSLTWKMVWMHATYEGAFWWLQTQS